MDEGTSVDPAPGPSGAAGAGEGPPQWVRVGDAKSMAARTEVRVHGRRITVLRVPPMLGEGGGDVLNARAGERGDVWAAVDAVCYHNGGPLGPQGTLQMVGERVCLQCPWHHYLVDVHTGEGLYRGFDFKMHSKGVRQRVHKVQARDDGGVWVLLADARHDKVASDEYAFGPKHPAIKSDYCDVPALDW